MRRIYFLVPGVETGRKLVEELLLARVEERQIHVIAHESTPLETTGMPEAGLLQSSDLVPALQRGVGVGWTVGLLAGLTAMVFPPAGLVLGGGAVLGAGAAGAAVGGLASSLVGVSLPSTRLRKFREAIEAGQLLMLVDVPKHRVEEIEEMVQRHHPEATVYGTESHVPAFP